MNRIHLVAVFFIAALSFFSVRAPGVIAAPVSSSNIPLDSPIYLYIEKLAGMGLVKSNIQGLKPFSRSEVARLVLEAEVALPDGGARSASFARDLISRIKKLIPREIALRSDTETAPGYALDPLLYARMRYVYLEGEPRSYQRDSKDPGHQSAFGIFGGDLRPFDGGLVHVTGTEGTPMLENNNGTIHPPGNSGELRFASEGYLSDYGTALVEPSILISEDGQSVTLEKGYLTVGSGGFAVEVGRDENWFGPGFRGTTTLTNNAQNFDQIKLWSPEPVDIPWVKEYLGGVKYSLVAARFDQTGSGDDVREPYFIGAKLAIKPDRTWEIGANFVRQMGGPGFSGDSGLYDMIFGGGENDHANTIAGVDLRFRLPQFYNIELYGEFSGEDNAGGVWPIVESYVAGVFVPCLTSSCRDDFRFEYFYGSVMLYGDWQFPAGYVYHDMTPGHSQGGAGVQEFYGRYSHWFDERNNLGLEYFYTERGRSYTTGDQVMESKHAGRVTWTVPVHNKVQAKLMYGIEAIDNPDLQPGSRTNQIGMLELSYEY